MISAVVAGMAVEAGIQKFIEKKVCIDYNRIVGEGLFSGAISAISFGTGNLLKCTIGPLAAKNALSTGTGLTAKTLAAALIANAAGGAQPPKRRRRWHISSLWKAGRSPR